jgi:hypothetical protein
LRAIIDEVLRYVEDGVTGPRLAEAEKALDRRALRVACTILLGCLKGQANPKAQHSFLLPEYVKYEWAAILRKLLTALPELAEVFAVEPEQITFRPEIPLQERLEIEEFIHARYGQGLRTKAN